MAGGRAVARRGRAAPPRTEVGESVGVAAESRYQHANTARHVDGDLRPACIRGRGAQRGAQREAPAWGMVGREVRLALVVCAFGSVLSQPAPPPEHDPFADGHLEQEDDECDKCDSHRMVGVGLLVFAMVLFLFGVVGVLRGFQASAAGGVSGILNPMLGGGGDEESGLYETYTPGFNEDGSKRVEGWAGDGRANRYMTLELQAQVKSKPKAPDARAVAAEAMKQQGTETYQEALRKPAGSPERSPLLLAAAETYEFALKKLGDVEDTTRDTTQVIPVWTACHLNLANLYLEIDEPAKAERHAGEVANHKTAFSLLPVASFKAHYRRGLARLALGKPVDAAEDLICARAHSPGDRKLAELCAETMRKIGKEDFFGVYKVVHAAGAQVKEGADKSSNFVATLQQGELVSVLEAKKNATGQMRLHVLPWKTGDVRGWTSLETESGVRILERTAEDFWQGGNTSSQSWQGYLEEAKAKVNQGLVAAQVVSSAPKELQEKAKAEAAQALEAARETNRKLQAGGERKLYRAVKPGIIRQGADPFTDKIGNLAVDQEVRRNRTRGSERLESDWLELSLLLKIAQHDHWSLPARALRSRCSR